MKQNGELTAPQSGCIGKEYEQMSAGEIHKQLVDLLGEQLAAQEIESWRAMNVVLESRELRPTHIRGRKPAG